MLLMMLVSLYTTRIVLEYLGAMSYGIFSVVGGILAMFTFVQGSLNLASNRYMSFAIGQNDPLKIKRTFTSALQIHALFGLLIVFLGETVGLWYFYNYLNIPIEYRTQAMIVYQLSLIGCAKSMLLIPITSSIIAHEDMSIFARFSVIDGLLKLAIAYALSLFDKDRLAVYALLNFSVGLFTFCLWAFICHKKYSNCRYIRGWDKALVKDMCKFVGWQFFGSLSWMTRTQGVNLVLNYFFGPILNTARNIAVQVNGGITALLNGFQMASNPQMVKSYAIGNIDEMYILVCRTSKLAYFLLLILAIPLYFSAESVLKFWLGNPPEYSIVFVKLMIIATLIENISGSLPNAFVASGKLKRYQPITAAIMISEILLVFIAFRLKMPPTYMFYAQFIIFLALFIARLIMLRPILGLNPKTFVSTVTVSELMTTALAVSLIVILQKILPENINIILLLTFEFAITVAAVLLAGLNKMERKWAISLVQSKLKI